MAIGGQAFLDNGSTHLYTGDDGPRGIFHMIFAGEVGLFVYSVKGGFHFHQSHTTYAGQPIGDEFIYAGAAGVRVANKKLVIGPEIYGSTLISSKPGNETPLEVLLGTHYTIGEDWRVGAGAGPGLSKAYGTPDLRILASVEWVPGYHPPVPAVVDSDGDGIPDNEDACPRKPGPRSDDPQKNGCPVIAPGDPRRGSPVLFHRVPVLPLPARLKFGIDGVPDQLYTSLPQRYHSWGWGVRRHRLCK
jgi:hypothetical protein